MSASGDLATLLRDATTAYLAGDRDRAVAVLETVRTRAQAEGAPLIEAEARRHLGSAYLALEQFGRAFDELTRARTLFAAAGDRPLEARCVLAMANVRRSQNQPAEALALARTAAAAFKDLGDDRGFVDAAEVVVYLLPDDADHDPIRSEALAVVDGQGRPLACGVLHEWGDGLFVRSRGGDAFTVLGDARDCFRRQGERDREARALVSLGRVYRLHGRLGDALAQYRQALVLHESPGSADRIGAVQAMNAIAVTLAMMGRVEEAAEQYAAALARARRTAPSVVPFFVANLGGFQIERGRYADALSLLDEAIAASPNTPHLARRLRPARRRTGRAGPDRRGRGVVRSRGDAGGEPSGRRHHRDPPLRARFLIDAGRFADAEADLKRVDRGHRGRRGSTRCRPT